MDGLIRTADSSKSHDHLVRNNENDFLSADYCTVHSIQLRDEVVLRLNGQIVLLIGEVAVFYYTYILQSF